VGRRDLRAGTTASEGRIRDVVDLTVRRNGETIVEAQAKFCQSTSRTTFELSDPRFDGLVKLHPSDQRVTAVTTRREVSGIGQRSYPDTARNASDRLAADGISGQALSRSEALNLGPRHAQRLATLEVIISIRRAALIGACVNGGLTLIANARQVVTARRDLRDAAVDVALESARGATDAVLKAGAGLAVRRSLVRAGFGPLARSSAPAAVAVTGVDVLKDLMRFADGGLSGDELAVRTGANVVKGTTAWAGMEGGALLGSMLLPGPGTIAGAILGGLIGGGFGAAVFG